MKERRVRSGIRKKFFTVRVERPLHRFPRKVVDALEVFKARLDRATWSKWKVSLSWVLELDDLSGPFQSTHSVIL